MGFQSEKPCWFKKDYRQRICRLGTVIGCDYAVWEDHCSSFPVSPPLHLCSSWGGTMTSECHQHTLGLPSPSCQSAGMAHPHPHGAHGLPEHLSAVQLWIMAVFVECSSSGPGWRAFSRNLRRSAKALHCCRSPRADKTHPDCTLLHPWHCIPACELINEPRNWLGLALGITEWVWVF